MGTASDADIDKITGLQSTASEIDDCVLGKFETLIEDINVSLEVKHSSQQGTTIIDAFLIHNYTDGKSAQLDNVGAGTILKLKNAYNPAKRLDKDNEYVGTGNFLVMEDSEAPLGVESNSNVLSFLNNAQMVYEKDGNVARYTQNNNSGGDDLTYAFQWDISYTHAKLFNFAEILRIWDEGINLLSMKYSKDVVFQNKGVNILQIRDNDVYFHKDINLETAGIKDTNGSTGTAGQVLTANGDGTCQWQ